MLKAKEILRLKYEADLSLRDIAKAVSCGKTTVSEVLERANKASISYPVDLSDKQLISLLYPPAQNKNILPEPDMENVFYEMKKKGVTLMLLWEEYKEIHSEGIMYTQFCERYRNFKKACKLTMHIEHKAGQEMQIDWAGQVLKYVDTLAGEIKSTNIFVAVLPASAYPFVYAYSDKKLANYIDAHIRAFEYFGGVPRVLIPDNEKTAVTYPNNTDPILNRSYQDMANHYHAAIVPTRSAKPKDKAADENMVGNTSRRILAPLRNRKFFSLYEINQAIDEQLKKFIARPFAKMEGNRLLAFEKIDKPALQSLPNARYEYCDWKEAKIAFNYHAEYEGFFYSADHSYAGKSCFVRATAKTIEIFVDGIRIATHVRNYNKFSKYLTSPEHMPENHKAVSGWSDYRFISWAEKIGPNTKMFIKEVLESRQYPVQSYRACMSILRFSKDSEQVMENAAKLALDKKTYSYKYFSIIFKQEMAKAGKGQNASGIIAHENIRGKSAFAGGGINA
ncbi:MAG: IS21 family transposase [Candidatus Humimicrobiaceae bacterium]